MHTDTSFELFSAAAIGVKNMDQRKGQRSMTEQRLLAEKLNNEHPEMS